MGSFDWIVFTSANGVDYFIQRLQSSPRDVRALAGVRLCAIGPAPRSGWRVTASRWI